MPNGAASVAIRFLPCALVRDEVEREDERHGEQHARHDERRHALARGAELDRREEAEREVHEPAGAPDRELHRDLRDEAP